MSSNTSMFSMFDVANARSEFGASLSSGGSGRPPILDSNNYWNPETQQRVLIGKAVGEGGDRWNVRSNDGFDLHLVNTYGTLASKATDAEYTVNATVSSIALTNNTATLGTTTAHNFLPTDVVVISGLTNTSFNGTYIVVTTPTATSFTFTLSHSNVSQTSDSGSAVVTRIANAKEQCDSSGNIQSRFDNTGALVFDRNLTAAPTRWGDGASIVIRQSAFGVTGGYVAVGFFDKNFLFNETLTKTNLSLQTYFLDDGSYYSGRSFIVSQDRNKITGQIAEMGGQTMIGASIDINAPGCKINNQLNLPGELFRYCFAAYDAADIDPNYPAGGVYSDRGFGKNKWLVGPKGEILWGPYLNPDRDDSDPEQHRYAKLWLNTTTNHITFEGTGQNSTTSYLDIFGPTGGNSVLRLGSRNKQNAMFIGTSASSEFIGQMGLDDVSFFNFYRKPLGVNGVAVAIGVDDASSVLTLDSAASNAGINVFTTRGQNGQIGDIYRAQQFVSTGVYNTVFRIVPNGTVQIDLPDSRIAHKIKLSSTAQAVDISQILKNDGVTVLTRFSKDGWLGINSGSSTLAPVDVTKPTGGDIARFGANNVQGICTISYDTDTMGGDIAFQGSAFGPTQIRSQSNQDVNLKPNGTGGIGLYGPAQGGIVAAANLTLRSTSHATKGKVLFGTTSAYDEANVRFGIGTQSPSAPLHINRPGSQDFILIQSTDTNYANIKVAVSSTQAVIGADSSHGYFRTVTNHPFAISTNNNRRIYIEAASGLASFGIYGFVAPSYTQDSRIQADCSSVSEIGITVATFLNQTAKAIRVKRDTTILMGINADGSIEPVSLADANAANKTIYYSTDANKLVFKDPSGVVNNLY